MSLTPWKKIKDPNFLGSWDLIAGDNGKGEPLFGTITATITSVQQEEVIDLQSKNSAKKLVPVVRFKECKPMILNTTNLKAIENFLKSPFIEYWIGKQITIGVDKVRAFGDTHDALRVKNYVPKPPKTYTCQDCGTQVGEDMAVRTQKAFGAMLCKDCGLKRSQEQEQAKLEIATTETETLNNNLSEIGKTTTEESSEVETTEEQEDELNA